MLPCKGLNDGHSIPQLGLARGKLMTLWRRKSSKPRSAPATV